jgi:transcriptional regulator with XRE-family HTH domain
MIILTPIQCRMARAALGLGVRELAAAAKVSIDTVARFERGDELKERTIEALQRTFEAAGVEFTNGDKPGVRLTRAAAARSAETAEATKPSAAAKAVRRQTANGPRKKR